MFHPLSHITDKDLPVKFTYPFHYTAHPLCRQAAEQLQSQLKRWPWNSETQGKMFGVLVVKNKNGKIGYLQAYSGNLGANIDTSSFVPPIFNYLDKSLFFYQGEQELINLNRKIDKFYHSKGYIESTQHLEHLEQELGKAIQELKFKNAKAKKERKRKRDEGKTQLNSLDFQKLNDALNKESQHQKAELKRQQKQCNEQLIRAKKSTEKLEKEVLKLKKIRQKKSAALQQQLFDQYHLLNAKNERKSLIEIFQDFNGLTPPAASGDCAAPRLLQYAYEKGLKPLAMAEFWWGKSPLTIIRKQGQYYPSCRSKCEPILSHMLQGLEMDENPISTDSSAQVSIIYEDTALLIINKPAGLLSVPGKTHQKSVADSLKEIRQDLKNIHIVHRLDMATSGLMLVAKNEKTYKQLQQQFLEGKVKKRYEALLDGIISKESGKIELPLRGDLDNRPQQMVCFDFGKTALTIWKKINEENGQTRVSMYPVTGRTHQLRVHAAHPLGLDTPIVGDELYGNKEQGLMLHAANIEFIHPQTGKKMKFSSKVKF